MTGPKLSAVLIVKNGSDGLREVLSAVSFCDEVVVLDSGSSDGSPEIAKRMGAQVHQRPFDNYASQKNHAVSLASGEWVLSIDADEVVTPALAAEIRKTIALPIGPAAFRVPRRTYFLRQLLRFGGHQSDRPVRLFRRSSARFEGRVHETVAIEGPIGSLRSSLLHYSTKTAREYFEKLNRYTDLEIGRMEEKVLCPTRSGLFLKPWARFLQKYLLQLGFADGWAGLIYAVLSGYYEFVRQAKFWQKSKNFSANM